MPFDIIRQDIALMDVDAIVSAVDAELILGSGVSQSIYNGAGEEYRRELERKRYIQDDEIFATSGFNLRAKFIFHTQTPIWRGGYSDEVEHLILCYKNILDKALELNIQSIAFPLLSAGNHRFPRDRALKIAMTTLQKFVLENDMQVYLVVYDFTSYFMSLKLSYMVKSYVEDRFVELEIERPRRLRHSNNEMIELNNVMHSRHELNLDDMIQRTHETFSQRLFRYIDARRLTDSEVYHKANIDRRLFSKIRSNDLYQPSKPTVIALAIALELNLDETKDLLQSAGYALSNARKFDVIIEFFISNGKYDIFEINSTLFYYELPSLG
jgi:O-acetyl-ADP-ribose deacetylase (regulator of RNase III)